MGESFDCTIKTIINSASTEMTLRKSSEANQNPGCESFLILWLISTSITVKKNIVIMRKLYTRGNLFVRKTREEGLNFKWMIDTLLNFRNIDKYCK